MKVAIVCTDERHPVLPLLRRWAERQRSRHVVELYGSVASLSGGDFLFLVSCQELVPRRLRDRYKWSLVLHASDLPKGRGMSPHVWQVIEGNNEVVVTLLNAEDVVDSGDIWRKRRIQLEGHELFDELNALVFDAELDLMDWALENCPRSVPVPQSGDPTFYRRRNPEDSRIDPGRSIEDQFDLLRVADPDRYPAFFELRGRRYRIVIEKLRSGSG